jgi:hypothetical protein
MGEERYNSTILEYMEVNFQLHASAFLTPVKSKVVPALNLLSTTP